MKWSSKLLLLFVLLFIGLFAFPGSVLANDEPGKDDKVVFGGTYVLSSGETLDGNLVVFGGNAVLEEGSRVKQNILIMGGSLIASGIIDGSLTIVGGSVDLEYSAYVKDSVTIVGGKFDRESGATIKGDVIDVTSGKMQLQLPQSSTLPPLPEQPLFSRLSKIFPRFPLPFPFSNYLFPLSWVDLDPMRDLAGGLFKALTIAALAALIVLILPKPTERVAHSIAENPVLTGGLGFLTAIVMPFIILVMIITLILIPVIPILLIVVAFACLYGWVAMGLEIGRRLEVLFRTHWEPPIAAGIGVLSMTFATSLVGWIPCAGWILPFLLIFVGLGGVIITRFGTEKIARQESLNPAIEITSENTL